MLNSVQISYSMSAGESRNQLTAGSMPTWCLIPVAGRYTKLKTTKTAGSEQNIKTLNDYVYLW